MLHVLLPYLCVKYKDKMQNKLRFEKDKEYIFVDGYNIINFWSIFKEHEESLEDQRKRLIDILSQYANLVAENVIVVFDGYMVKKSPGAIYEENGVKIVFTKEFETADHFIEKTLDKIGRVRKIRVATSDNIEQQIILSRGGTRISAREFEVEVEIAMSKVKRKTKELREESLKISSLDEEHIEILKNLKKDIKWHLK